MTNAELTAKYDALIHDPLKVKSVEHVNHKPHPYTVGPKHVAHAADHHYGMLGEETLKAVKCARKGCKIPYDEHTSDRVLFLQLTRHATQAEVKAVLTPELGAMMEADKIDGVAFVETSEGFQFS